MGPLASVYLGGGDCLCTFVLLFLFPVLIKPLLALPIDTEIGDINTQSHDDAGGGKPQRSPCPSLAKLDRNQGNASDQSSRRLSEHRERGGTQQNRPRAWGMLMGCTGMPRVKLIPEEWEEERKKGRAG